MVRVLLTIVGVLLTVGVFTALWVGANLVFSQATGNFVRFNVLIGGFVGAIFMAIIDGNRLVTGLVARPTSLFNGDDPGVFTDGIGNAIAGHLFWPVVGAMVGAGLGYFMAIVTDRRQRLLIGAGVGLVVGVAIGFMLKTSNQLALVSTPLIVWPVVLIVIGVAVARLRGRNLLHGAVTGALVGWLAGTFGGGLLGHDLSTVAQTVIATGVAGLLAGVRIGLTNRPGVVERAKIEDKSIAWLFVGPAVLFITVMLVVPAIQTVLLSLQSDDAESITDGFVAFENYQTVFSDPKNFNTDDVATLFTSAEGSTSIFPWGGSALIPWVVFFAAAGVVLSLLLGRELGQKVKVAGAPLAPFILAITLFLFALFTHVRGTIVNNLWWVVGVTVLSTSLGLAIAKLADGAKFESTAKSMIFMPMAISMVGASIIWRLIMYQARDTSKPQTGVFNAVWIWLGENTTEWASAGSILLGLILGAAVVAVLMAALVGWDRVPSSGLAQAAAGLVVAAVMAALAIAAVRSMGGKMFFGLVFALAAAGMAALAVKALRSSASMAGLYFAISIIPLWVALRTIGDGIGGFVVRDGGEILPQTVNFVQSNPYNNFFLMMILIWIQTGFAMVILSAAIKAVPAELIEAGQIDGATGAEVFWQITVPQIAPTIGVVATTIMVNVMKVFDIVKVTTNGQFDSQVLANAMFEQAFLFSNQGVGAAMAVLIFVGILPIMVYNIVRSTREA